MFDRKETIPMLLEKVCSILVPTANEIERITYDFNKKNDCDIKVIRLPVAHSELNAIELIWAMLKVK